jgi:cytochrome c553
MSPKIRSTLVAFLVVGGAAAAFATARGDTAARRVERGRYLVATMSCNDCHTPWTMGANGPAPDMSRALSGHPAELAVTPVPELPEGPWLMVGAATNTAWAGPWGVSFTPNLTPDDETGIGRWSEELFFEIVRSGKHLGRGRPILPPMPIASLQNLSDEDLRSLFAYLKSLPAIANRVPDPLPPLAPAR